MMLDSIAGLVVYSGDVAGALSFYRDQMGIPLALARHGGIKDHYEAALRNSHVAIFPGAPRLVPSFRVANLTQALMAAENRGAARVFGPMDLGEGKRVAGVSAPDGFEIRMIEIHD
jgi:hypothetical protein